MRQLYNQMDAPFQRHRNPITDAFMQIGMAPDIYNAAERDTYNGLAQGREHLSRSKLYDAQAEDQALRTQGLRDIYTKHPIGAPATPQQTGGQRETVASAGPPGDGNDWGEIAQAFQDVGRNFNPGKGYLYMPPKEPPASAAPVFTDPNPGKGVELSDTGYIGELGKTLAAIPRERVPQMDMPVNAPLPAPADRFNPSNPDHLFPYLLRVDDPKKLQEAVSQGFLTGQQAMLIDNVNKLAIPEVDKISAKAQIMGGKGLDLYDTTGEIRGRSETALAGQHDATARAEDARAGRFQTESINALAHADSFGASADRTRKLTPHEIDTEKAKAENFRATAGKNEAQGGLYDSKKNSLGNGGKGMSEKDYAKAIQDRAKVLGKENIFRKGGPVSQGQIMTEAKRDIDNLIAGRREGSGSMTNNEGIEPPVGAVELLRKNPNMAIAFDAKYGAGMARKYLEGK